MDRLMDVVLVRLDEVDIPRSAVSVIGIGFVKGDKGKQLLCLINLRSNFQLLSPIMMWTMWRYQYHHSHFQESQVYLLD